MAHPHVDDLGKLSGGHAFIVWQVLTLISIRIHCGVVSRCLPLNFHLDNCLFPFLCHIAVNYRGDTAGLYKLPLRRVTRSCLGRHQARWATDVFMQQPGQSDIYWLSGSPTVRHSVSQSAVSRRLGKWKAGKLALEWVTGKTLCQPSAFRAMN